MSKVQKLIERFKSEPKDFQWKELLRLLNQFNIHLKKNGTGSARTFSGEEGLTIQLHEPHNNDPLKQYQMKFVREKLEERQYL